MADYATEACSTPDWTEHNWNKRANRCVNLLYYQELWPGSKRAKYLKLIRDLDNESPQPDWSGHCGCERLVAVVEWLWHERVIPTTERESLKRYLERRGVEYHEYQAKKGVA